MSGTVAEALGIDNRGLFLSVAGRCTKQENRRDESWLHSRVEMLAELGVSFFSILFFCKSFPGITFRRIRQPSIRLGEPGAQRDRGSLAVAGQAQCRRPRPRPDHDEARELAGQKIAGRAEEAGLVIHPRKRKSNFIRDGLHGGEAYSP